MMLKEKKKMEDQIHNMSIFSLEQNKNSGKKEEKTEVKCRTETVALFAIASNVAEQHWNRGAVSDWRPCGPVVW